MPEKNLVMFLLSVKAGLRAKEIAEVSWCDVLIDDEVSDNINITNSVSKGSNGGRIIPLNKDLKKALADLWEIRRQKISNTNLKIIYNQSGNSCSANSVVRWFFKLYEKMGYSGVSSHSGRRTAITRMARKISTVGGSLKDIQEIAGHSSIQNTQRYIDSNKAAKQKVVDLV
jgi:integrase/recombinase XerD